jgi:Trypsin-like peptidase domain
MPSDPRPALAEAVIRVGDGRGFIVATDYDERLVITAGHCLPALPIFHGASYTEERTLSALLALIGAEPSVSAECLFADPIADLAILGSPDDQALFDEARAYDALIGDRAALAIQRPKLPEQRVRGWLFSLEGDWFACEVIITTRSLWIENAARPLVGGMSGSPIVGEDGSAIGVVCAGNDEHGGGPNPCLARALPVWAFSELIPSPESAPPS